MKKLCLLFMLSLLPLLGVADNITPTWYQVELIIFKNNQVASDQPEAFSIAPQQPDLNNVIKLSAAIPGSAVTAFQLLPNQDFKLKNVLYRLEKSPNYQVILHLSWYQPLRSPANATPIQIQGGQLYDASGQVISPDTASSSSNYSEINGSITLSLQHFINVQTNLLFTAPTRQLNLTKSQNSDDQAALISFPMRETRRTRSNQLNYFDHPYFGMLIEIFPLKNSAEATNT